MLLIIARRKSLLISHLLPKYDIVEDSCCFPQFLTSEVTKHQNNFVDTSNSTHTHTHTEDLLSSEVQGFKRSFPSVYATHQHYFSKVLYLCKLDTNLVACSFLGKCNFALHNTVFLQRVCYRNCTIILLYCCQLLLDAINKSSSVMPCKSCKLQQKQSLFGPQSIFLKKYPKLNL